MHLLLTLIQTLLYHTRRHLPTILNFRKNLFDCLSDNVCVNPRAPKDYQAVICQYNKINNDIDLPVSRIRGQEFPIYFFLLDK